CRKTLAGNPKRCAALGRQFAGFPVRRIPAMAGPWTLACTGRRGLGAGPKTECQRYVYGRRRASYTSAGRRAALAIAAAPVAGLRQRMAATQTAHATGRLFAAA